MNEENKILEENIKRHINVLVEGMDDKFKLLAEGQKTLESKLNNVAQDLSIVKQDVELLKEDIDYVKGELGEIKNRFKEVDGVTDNYEKRLIKLENRALAKA